MSVVFSNIACVAVCTYLCPHRRNVAPMYHLNNNKTTYLFSTEPVRGGSKCSYIALLWCDYKIFSWWYDVRERREVEGHVCQCQLGLREGARSTIRRWGHFSVAPQSATRQDLTVHTAPQSDQIIILTGRMTVILVQWWQTNSKVVSSYLSDLMRLKLSEEHSFHQTHKPSVTSLSDGHSEHCCEIQG